MEPRPRYRLLFTANNAFMKTEFIRTSH
jgi:hypothetical protein